jgi:hypothetical protein
VRKITRKQYAADVRRTVAMRKQGILRVSSIRAGGERVRRLLRLERRLSGVSMGLPPEKATWQAPDAFGLSPDDHKGMVRSICAMRQAFRSGHVHLDFSALRKLDSAATLLWLAEFDRLRSAFNRQITYDLPEADKVLQVFRQIGLLEMLGDKAVNVTPVDDDVIHWRYASGNNVNGTHYDAVLGHYDGILAKPMQDALYTGITEAMANVLHHAYDGQRQDGMSMPQTTKRWWMFSQCREGRLSVVFCDLGIGIPRSLPVKQRTPWLNFIRVHKKWDCDHGRIAYAIEKCASRTKEAHRGKGLGQIVDGVMGQGGQVIIYSNEGFYARGPGQSRAIKRTLSANVLGTVICWQLPIEE